MRINISLKLKLFSYFSHIKLNREHILLASITLLACSLPLHARVNSVFLISSFVLWLFDKNILEKLKRSFHNRWFLVIAGFFVLNCLGLLYSANQEQGIINVVRKISFFVFPLIFCSEKIFNKVNLNKIFKFYVWACAGSLLISEGHGFYYYIVHNRFDFLSYELFAIKFMHPGYYSNFFLIALFWLVLGFLEKDVVFSFNKKARIFLSIFFIVGIGQLTSKTALIIFILFSIGIILKLLFSKIETKTKLIGMAVVMLAFSVVLLTTYKLIAPRLTSIANEIKQGTDKKIEFTNSIGSRATTYKVEWQIIKEKPMLGHGTGSANEILMQKLIEGNYTSLVKNKMHTHNQFLQTGIELGFLGMLYLLVLVILLLYYFFQKRIGLGFWLTVLMFINCATDDMLNVQAGAVSFIFFISLVLLSYKKGNSFELPLN